MADITTKHQPLAPGDIPIKFKDLGDGTYAQYLALEPSSIGSGSGTSSSVTLADAVTASQKAAVSAAGALKVDNSGVTQPISAAALPLPAGAATDATLTGGTVSTKAMSLVATALPTLTNGNQQQLLVSGKGGQYMVYGDINGNVVNSPNDPNADGIAANFNAVRTTGVQLLFNGTTYDRLRGSAARGADANITNTSLAVTGPLTDTQLRATAVPVSGTFFQGTQPVSLATNTPDVTDRAARLLGHVTVDNASIPVTGTFFQATQPISAAALPLPAGAATSASQSAVKAASTLAAATDTSQVVAQSPMRADASNLAVTATGLTAAAVTLTIPAPAAGLFHYITSIQIVKFATALLTAAATPVLVTTTNLPGSPVYSFSAAASAQGTSEVQQIIPTTPFKSSVAATATTIVCPLTTATLWRVNVTYYTAP